MVTGGVLGIDACACSEQFFKQVLDPYTVRCWPCGKLQCDENTQVQSGCWAEPSCECRIPSGSETYTSNRYCAFSCAEGYINTPQVTFDEKVRVGSALIIANGSSKAQTMHTQTIAIPGGRVKQALPVVQNSPPPNDLTPPHQYALSCSIVFTRGSDLFSS